MSLFAGDDGKLHAEVSPPGDDERFRITSALLVLRLWRESEQVVRCAVHHPASGTVAYLQGSEDLVELVRTLGLALRR